MTVSTAAGKVLTGSGPQGILVPFWANKKEPAPQGGTLQTKKWE